MSKTLKSVCFSLGHTARIKSRFFLSRNQYLPDGCENDWGACDHVRLIEKDGATSLKYS